MIRFGGVAVAAAGAVEEDGGGEEGIRSFAAMVNPTGIGIPDSDRIPTYGGGGGGGGGGYGNAFGVGRMISPDGATESIQRAREGDERKSEIGWFSAMANPTAGIDSPDSAHGHMSGSSGSSPDGGGPTSDNAVHRNAQLTKAAKDEEQRKIQIGMFSAMANPTSGIGSHDSARSYMSGSGGSSPDGSGRTSDNAMHRNARLTNAAKVEEQRKNEIGMFSAMANPTAGIGSPDNARSYMSGSGGNSHM